MHVPIRSVKFVLSAEKGRIGGLGKRGGGEIRGLRRVTLVGIDL